jgi:hypothetical protein
VVVEGDNAEILFFVSPEFRRNQLYPERQELSGNEDLKLAIQELRQLLQEMRTAQQQEKWQAPRQQEMPQSIPPVPQPIAQPLGAIRTNCVIGVNGQACHGGAQPASGLDLTQQAIADAEFRSSLEQMVTGDMPKDRELDQMTKNRVLLELLSRKP